MRFKTSDLARVVRGSLRGVVGAVIRAWCVKDWGEVVELVFQQPGASHESVRIFYADELELLDAVSRLAELA